MELIKKCDKSIFEKILSGEKKFEVRLGNLEVSKGDTLILKECEENNGSETGREIKKKVGFLLRTQELLWWSEEDKNKLGFVVMQLEDGN